MDINESVCIGICQGAGAKHRYSTVLWILSFYKVLLLTWIRNVVKLFRGIKDIH